MSEAKRLEVTRLRQTLADQEAWGKWNTAPTANRLAALEDELRPAWLRVTRRAGFWAFVLAYCFLFWFSIGAGIWGFISPLIRGMMGQG
ncbi:hypothetical protein RCSIMONEHASTD_47 [Rhodobacter phage RcSimone-Hastad]|nr:hypothetical protein RCSIMONEHASTD_47 [Rhodobacter phage RcSimone-Hastad]